MGNDALTADLDTDDAWIRARAKTRERRLLEPERTTPDLCVEAAWQALRSSGLTAADLDAVVVATMTPDQPIPSPVLLVMDVIGARRALPVDLNQGACAGGVLALHTGASLLRSPQIRHVLVIGADVMSRITGPADRTTRVFFGDARRRGARAQRHPRLRHPRVGLSIRSWAAASRSGPEGRPCRRRPTRALH